MMLCELAVLKLSGSGDFSIILLGFQQSKPTVLLENNTSAIALANRPPFGRRFKHIGVKYKYHKIRELAHDRIINKLLHISRELVHDRIINKLLHIGTEQQWAMG
jgi:hypothetical protein